MHKIDDTTETSVTLAQWVRGSNLFSLFSLSTIPAYHGIGYRTINHRDYSFFTNVSTHSHIHQ